MMEIVQIFIFFHSPVLVMLSSCLKKTHIMHHQPLVTNCHGYKIQLHNTDLKRAYIIIITYKYKIFHFAIDILHTEGHMAPVTRMQMRYSHRTHNSIV